MLLTIVLGVLFFIEGCLFVSAMYAYDEKKDPRKAWRRTAGGIVIASILFLEGIIDIPGFPTAPYLQTLVQVIVIILGLLLLAGFKRLKENPTLEGGDDFYVWVVKKACGSPAHPTPSKS